MPASQETIASLSSAIVGNFLPIESESFSLSSKALQ